MFYGFPLTRGRHSFCSCVVGDDALHRPAVLTSTTSSQDGINQVYDFPLTLCPSFSVRPENEAKDALKSTYGSLDNHSLLPTHIGVTLL